MIASEQRAHARVACFLVGTTGHIQPVYSFRSPDEPDAIAALVVDISDGGIQILTEREEDLENQSFHLSLFTGDTAGHDSLDAGVVHWVWSRPDGMYVRSGFVARKHPEILPELLDSLSHADHKALRCVLHPVAR